MIDCPLCKKENRKKANKQKYKAVVNTEQNAIICKNPKCKLHPHISEDKKHIDKISLMTSFFNNHDERLDKELEQFLKDTFL